MGDHSDAGVGGRMLLSRRTASRTIICSDMESRTSTSLKSRSSPAKVSLNRAIAVICSAGSLGLEHDSQDFGELD